MEPGSNTHLIGEAGGRARLNTPALLLDLDALDRNIERMAAHCRRTGQALRPHAKTHKSIEVARRQIAAGAVGQCCATLGEAEVLAGAGIPGVLVTSPVVGPGRTARLVALNEAAEGLMAVADDPGAVAALAEASTGKPLSLLVDIDVGTRRTGVLSAQTAVALARQIDEAPGLVFAGIQGYAGHLQHVYDYGERAEAVAAVSERLAHVSSVLADAGLAPPLVTGGGTGTHDLDYRHGVLGELQAGSFAVMDVDYGRVALTEDGSGPFEPAMFVMATVVSAAGDEFAIIDAGLKALATDGPMPLFARGAPEGATFSFAGDEHGRVHYAGGNPARLKVGDIVELHPPHCDPTVNLYDVYHAMRGEMLEAIWPVDARGRR